MLIALAPTLTTVLVVVLILALLASMPRWGYNRGWGYGPFGLILTVVLAIVILKLLHVI